MGKQAARQRQRLAQRPLHRLQPLLMGKGVTRQRQAQQRPLHRLQPLLMGKRPARQRQQRRHRTKVNGQSLNGCMGTNGQP